MGLLSLVKMTQLHGAESFILPLVDHIISLPEYKDDLYITVRVRDALIDGVNRGSIKYALEKIKEFPFFENFIEDLIEDTVYANPYLAVKDYYGKGITVFKGSRHNTAYNE
jgi:hypothetical protein